MWTQCTVIMLTWFSANIADSLASNLVSCHPIHNPFFLTHLHTHLHLHSSAHVHSIVVSTVVTLLGCLIQNMCISPNPHPTIISPFCVSSTTNPCTNTLGQLNIMPASLVSKPEFQQSLHWMQYIAVSMYFDSCTAIRTVILKVVISCYYCWKSWNGLEWEPFHVPFTFSRISSLISSNQKVVMLLGWDRLM